MKSNEKTSGFAPGQNKINEYFESLPVRDGIDHIGNLSKYLKPVEITPGVDETIRLDQLFRKMLVSMVACSLGTGLNKKCLVLVCEAQNSGMSAFLQWLCPPALADYYFDASEKSKDDLKAALTENFIIDFGELSTLSESDVSELVKAITTVSVKVRPPYTERPVMLQRRCNFVASANSFNFLLNVNHSSRFVLFHVSEIYQGYISKIDINKVWGQAFHLLKSIDFKYKLTDKEKALGKCQQGMYLSKVLETKAHEMGIDEMKND